MVQIGWILAGLAVLVAILAIGLRINRKKSVAHLAVRSAEVYRNEGDFETARRLYDVAPELDQNVEPAREGRRRAEEGSREPVIDEALLAAARRRLRDEREGVEARLRRAGVDVELPAVEE